MSLKIAIYLCTILIFEVFINSIKKSSSIQKHIFENVKHMKILKPAETQNYRASLPETHPNLKSPTRHSTSRFRA